MNIKFLSGIILTFIIEISADPLNRLNCYVKQESQGISQLVNQTCSAQYSDPAAEIIQSLYTSITNADCELAHPCDFPPHYSPENMEEFDFIIVGAGSAGSVVANRLTEVSNWRVLLLEAGEDPKKTTEVPSFVGSLWGTEIDWQYQTNPNENNCLGMERNRCNWPRGKVLGGSSSINGMVYSRGNARDYDMWAADGNTGWRYNDILYYFKKSEDMRAKEVLKTQEFRKYHGTGGYLKVESWRNDDVKPLSSLFAEGMKELGYPVISDGNGKRQTGFILHQSTMENGRRCSTAKAFLSPITKRQNLKVSKNSLVSKILINEKKKTAYGVEFIDKCGKIITVWANKEVILSAGAINTPQLLMLSGVGPRRHLEQLNIKIVKDLPVGDNLQDHALMNNLVISLNFTMPSKLPEESMFDFLLKIDIGLGLRSYKIAINTANKSSNFGDVSCLLSSVNKNDTKGLLSILRIYGYRGDIINKYLKLNSDSFVVIVSCSLLRPYSKGTIRLKSINPKEYPKITAGYLSDERDFEPLLQTYDFLSSLIRTKELKKFNAQLHEIKVSHCNKFAFTTRKYRECCLRHLVTTTYHPSSTCKMGPASSHESVVDPYLRVKGINKLRVIDASIMPRIVSGALNAPTIMIGEKGSDLVKETWLPRKTKNLVKNRQKKVLNLQWNNEPEYY